MKGRGSSARRGGNRLAPRKKNAQLQERLPSRRLKANLSSRIAGWGVPCLESKEKARGIVRCGARGGKHTKKSKRGGGEKLEG